VLLRWHSHSSVAVIWLWVVVLLCLPGWEIKNNLSRLPERPTLPLRFTSLLRLYVHPFSFPHAWDGVFIASHQLLLPLALDIFSSSLSFEGGLELPLRSLLLLLLLLALSLSWLVMTKEKVVQMLSHSCGK
jgi:hypothetical protein